MKYFKPHHVYDKNENASPSLFNIFLDDTLYIYKHRWEEIGADHLSIPNKSINVK